MSSKLMLLASFAGTGLFFMAVAVPMMCRWVPPNRFYGLRVPATFADEWVWYEANARSGHDFFLVGTILALVMGVLYFMPGLSLETYGSLGTTLIIGGTLWTAIRGWLTANRLLEERKREEESEEQQP